MSALSVLFLVLPLPLAYIIHVAEEVAWQRLKLKRKLKSKTLPGRAGGGFKLGALILMLVVTGYVLVGGPYAMPVWSVLFVAFSLHLVMHIVQGIGLRDYVPGLVTSILLLPFACMGLHSIWLALSGWQLMVCGLLALAAVGLSRQMLMMSILVCLVPATMEARDGYEGQLHTTTGEQLGVADPCVYEADGLYYLSASAEGGFDYYTSRDLLTWEYRGELFRVPDGEPVRTMLWASEVAVHDGTYYLTYSGWDPRTNNLTICLATATQPAGPFVIQKSPWIVLPKNGVIDANLFWDQDGTPYVYLSENGFFGASAGGELRMARLKRDMSGLDTPLQTVCPDRQPWEMHMLDPRNYCNEAPEVFLSRGTYYMVYSANETHNGHYGMGVMTAPSPLGPWVKDTYNPIMQTHYEGPTNEHGIPAISSPGHCGLVLNKRHTAGYMLYHQHAPWVQAYPSNDRVTCITRFKIKRGKLCLKGGSQKKK